MTFSRSDFAHIKWNALLLLAVLGAGGALIAATQNYVAQAQQEQQTLQRQQGEARAHLATAQADQENMQTYTQEYNILLRRNIVGEGQRLDWIETLDKMRKQQHARGLMNFNYSITPQQHYTPIPAVDSGNYELNASGMVLQFDLLHEGQLLDFLDTLRNNTRGWFILTQCTVQRSATLSASNVATTLNDEDASVVASRAAGQNFVPQLKAECTGAWLTLKNRNAAK